MCGVLSLCVFAGSVRREFAQEVEAPVRKEKGKEKIEGGSE